jgi:hypothetical protein
VELPLTFQTRRLASVSRRGNWTEASCFFFPAVPGIFTSIDVCCDRLFGGCACECCLIGPMRIGGNLPHIHARRPDTQRIMDEQHYSQYQTHTHTHTHTHTYTRTYTRTPSRTRVVSSFVISPCAFPMCVPSEAPVTSRSNETEACLSGGRVNSIHLLQSIGA